MAYRRLSWRRILLANLLLWSLGACYPSISVETPVFLPEETARVVTTARETATVTAIPVSTEVYTQTQPSDQIMIRAEKTATETAEKETDMPVTHSLTITIVFDNNLLDSRLKSTWGFSALIEYQDQILLFDTGGDGSILMENMRILGIDPENIDSVVLSHAHRDHTGGLGALLGTGARPIVYIPPSFAASFKNQVSALTEVTEVTPGYQIAERMFSTGEMGKDIPEQALVITTEDGLVIITGCAHPGIVEIVTQARSIFDEPVQLVLGGYHLRSKSEAEIEAILKDFRRLGVKKVAPSHCTGDYAIAMFAAEFGDDFILAGVGKTIQLENTGQTNIE
jgi:7,8-dihydropterin-6-yl-methyl-4-(beta-D-ribofuranosyl)aminobenzene 5'-phosphate synthase